MITDYRESFEQIKIAGSLAADALDEVTPFVKPGVSTDQLDKICKGFRKLHPDKKLFKELSFDEKENLYYKFVK